MSHGVEAAEGQSALPRWGWAALNLLQFVFTLAWTMGCVSLALLVYALTGGRRRVPLRMASWLWASGLLRASGGRFEVEGLERVDWSQPYVLVANHQSVLDICALFRAVPVPLRFLLKQEMTRVPFVNWYAKAMGMVFIPRDDRRGATQALRRSAELVRSGAVLCIFPEGTRSRDGTFGRFKPGAFQVAIESGARVLPVALEGTGAVLPPDGAFRARPGLIRVRFGTPLELHADGGPLDRQQLAARAQDAVEGLLRDG
ncbi:lysophospholipid acyltransferase family protein [Luteimonas sp. A277]